MTAFEIAQTYIGLKEVAGAVNNNQIVEMLQLVDKNENNDETPWCSAFVNWVAKESGAEMSRSLMARSWLNVGRKILLSEAISAFDVVVLKSPENPSSTTKGHVGFYHSHDSEKIYLLGGNQDNRVKVKGYDLKLLLDIRRIKELDLMVGLQTNLRNYDLEIKQVLRLGDRNTDVLKLQQKLKDLGFYHSTIDGIFGPITFDAVKNFQNTRNLESNGVAGKETFTALNYTSTQIKEAWTKKALALISFYETSLKNPWASVTGNFDGQGISCGAFQWNIGQGSLQPFIKTLGRYLVLEKMPNYGDFLWNASNSNIKDGLQIISENFLKDNKHKTVKDDALVELKNLLNTDESKNYQISKAQNKAISAKKIADSWALNSRQSPSCTL